MATRKTRSSKNSRRSQRGKPKRNGITYSGQASTHDTDGLPGYPAVDLFAKPGTAFLAPENGRVVRLSGRGGTSGQVYGYSLYFVGVSGRVYFITHLNRGRAPVGSYQRGDVLGTVSPWTGGSPHAHVGVHDGSYTGPTGDTSSYSGSQPASAGPSPSPQQPSVLSPPDLGGYDPNSPSLPELPGSAPSFVPSDPSEAWRMMAEQSFVSPETQRWAKLHG